MAYIGFNPSQQAVTSFSTKNFTGDGTTTTFTLDQAVPGANEANVDVYVENVHQNPIDAYTIGGVLNNQLIFSEAPVNGASIYVIHKGESTYQLMPATGSVNADALDPVLRNFTVDTFTGNGSTTSYTLSATALSPNAILVMVDGITQTAGVNYTVSGTTLSFGSTAPDNGSAITVVHLGFASGIKSVMDRSITPLKLSTGGPSWDTSSNMVVNGMLGIGQSTPTEKIHVLDGKIAVQGDTTTPTTGHAFFYKQSAGATVSGYQTILETGSAGSRAERVRVTFDGNVGINSTSPNGIGTNVNSRTLTVAGNGATTGARGVIELQNPITLAGITSGTSVGSFYYSMPGYSSINAGYAQTMILMDGYTSGNGGSGGFGGTLNLYTKADNSTSVPRRFTIDHNGLIDIPYGQIKFPAAQNASSDPNTLDDYEEGTWTPIITGSSTNPTVTYARQYGKYTKVGNLVHVQIDLRWSALSGGSGNAYLTLPFTSANDQYSGGVVAEKSSGWALSANYTYMTWENNVGTGYLILLQSGNGVGTAGMTYGSNVPTGNSYIIGSFTYTV